MSRGIAIAVAALIALRFIAGAVLPLSADEAYYWLWSKRLAAGYYDHPPAIAYLIRAGTVLFGRTSFGVRFVPLLLSLPTTWFVWRSAKLLTGDEAAGASATLFFNLMLMTAVETMAATPDAPLIAASAMFLWTLAELQATEDGRWWIAAGAAGGLALLSKYTAFFLGAGALAWILFTREGRRWLASPWPYLGAALALAIFSPNVWWNASHHWETFVFQFGRVGAGHFTLRYLAEFLAAQLLLASPVILYLGIRGTTRSALLAALAMLPVVFFAVHSLHDRVQGNWPCFLYPMLAVAAALAPPTRLRRTAAPVAALMLLLAYAQVHFDVISLGRRDPASRLLGFGVAKAVQAAERQQPVAVLTTDYETTAWFSFYGDVPVFQVNEPERGLGGHPAPGRKLYVAETTRDRHALVPGSKALGPVDRARNGRTLATYVRYVVP